MLSHPLTGEPFGTVRVVRIEANRVLLGFDFDPSAVLIDRSEVHAARRLAQDGGGKA